MNTFRLLPCLGAMLLSVLLLSSCDKDNKDPDFIRRYMPLQVGNYWVYQQFEVIDSTGGKVKATQNYDSCYIQKDTMIGGDTYYKYIHHLNGVEVPRFLKDSSHYLVDYNAGVVFSAQDTTALQDYYLMSTPLDTIARVVLMIGSEPEIVSTPTLTLSTINARRTMYFVHTNPGGAVRSLHTCYAVGVGIVKETLPYNYTQYKTIERRLLRYRLH